MAPLIDLVNQQLDDNAVSQLSQQLGVDPNTTRQAVPAALTALLGGLSHNASQPAGAEQLLGALSKDHDGSVFDNLGELLGGGGAHLGQQGAGILGHIFGNRQPAVATQVGRASGLDGATAAKLLMMLAPLVLGALGRAQRQRGLDSGGLSDVLTGERNRVQETNPQHGGLLNVLLDRDGDGNIMDDLAGMAGGLLGGGRR
ncbi:MAG TPA: DUF937 domain-containing protein [Thermoanaerobaculia bacterium]|nr:DUF937 domain-containing protein [Thermoanaerobaculia bacterium]